MADGCTALTTSPEADAWIALFLLSNAEDKPPLLDLRRRSLYSTSHVTHATHFDGLEGPNGLLLRFNELPPPQSRAQTAIVAEDNVHAQKAVEVLAEKGYIGTIVLHYKLLSSRLPTTSGVVSRALWAPAPIVVEEIDYVLQHITRKTALDIGAGSGRDSAFLAMHGFSVTAVDRDKLLISKAVRLASREDQALSCANLDSSCKRGAVQGIARTLGAHLREDRNWLRANASQLLLVVRFLRRGVLEILHEAVAQGGFVVYEHFLRGCEEFGGPKKASQMLEMGELSNVFTEERGFSVIRDDVRRLADGRPVVRFVAHRNREPALMALASHQS